MSATTPITIEIHPKFAPLLKVPHTFASIRGGRGGMKSEQVHKIALLDAIDKPIRTCCARETMSSIKDSSHKLLSDVIHQYGMARSQNGPYEIQADRIIRKDGGIAKSEFIFIGIRENVRDSKSLKGINRTIIEEAGKVSADSWEVFPPTVLREPGAQLWAIWNPEYTSDPTWQFFQVNTPSNTIHIETSYLENPWLSETMRVLAEDCKLRSMADYEHIWLGKPRSEVVGAIYGDEMRKAQEEGRICRVPYDRTKPVHTFWDLGFGDKTAIWFGQAYGGWYNFIDYLEDEGKELHYYLTMLQERGYVYGVDWMPHDALDVNMHRKLGGDRSRSIEGIMRAVGRRVRMCPKTYVADGINAVRMFLPTCRFDEEKCAKGLDALRLYQWGPRDKQGMNKREPLHNAASHGSDAFRGAAMVMKHPPPEEPKDTKPAVRIPVGRDAWMVG